MDLLAKRYASPFTLLDEMICRGRFYEFVLEINQIIVEEKDEQQLWEIWLHKVFDKSYDEWVQKIRSLAEAQHTDKSQLETTVKNSMELLNGFNPNEGG